MPELAEVEAYRRLVAARALDRVIESVDAPDAWYLKGGLSAPTAQAALAGRCLLHTRRQGKLLMVETTGDGPVLGLRFGMSGRVVIDGTPAVDELWYASNRDEAKWDRFTIRFADGGRLAMRDPRRLGGVCFDPAAERLGPDALDVTVAQLRRAMAIGRAMPRGASTARGGRVASSTTSLKARLLDQARIAGVGNLAADEILWRAALVPDRPAASLTDAELRRLHRHLRATLAGFIAGGGSHTGTLMPERHPGGICPNDGVALVRATIATRTTWWCPFHQH